ncbi:MAG TPA: hypothetical protein VFQ35_21055 [Polyangiaceae bacterium]|nr:hypothetical protein [Polyangiaceae bacterium]
MELSDPARLSLVVRRYGEALTALELEPGQQPLVLPTSEWFPDEFKQDQESLERLIARMQGYAGLEKVDIEVALSGMPKAAGCGTGGCGSGACGTEKAPAEAPQLSKTESGYSIAMPGSALSHPIAFTASIARMLGCIRLIEAGNEEPDAAISELAAVGLGFGVLLLEASYLYNKSCGGPSVGTATALPLADLALPFALFLATEGHKPRRAMGELATTQRAVLDEACALASSNRTLVQRLREAPERVARGDFSLGETRSWFSRLFSSSKPRKVRDVESAALAALERGEDLDSVAALLQRDASAERTSKSPAAGRANDDVQSLVDEALAELRSERGGGPSPAE